MTIGSFRHKGLRRLHSHDDSRALPAAAVDKLRKMLGFLEAMSDERELHAIPAWRAHKLTGDRKGDWSLFVTRNWRLTFWIDTTERTVEDLNFEDYH